MPLVFWDEFDTKLAGERLGWLRFFLAPMEKGEFVEDQITHPLGRCIFVFAGGTTHSREELEATYGTKKYSPLKVRDFLSRLHGFLNVLGINEKDEPSAKPPRTDAPRLYLIRRAVLLRSLLHKHAPGLFEVPENIPFIQGRTPRGELRIDRGVLRAFLETREYKHGSRSMRVIVENSTLEHKKRFDRSSLPSKTLLNLHVDADDFERRLFHVKPARQEVTGS